MKLMKIEEPQGLLLIMNLDDMNIRGSQIWVGWKDWAEENMEKFVSAINDRNQEMIDFINEKMLAQKFTEQAVTGQASWNHQ